MESRILCKYSRSERGADKEICKVAREERERDRTESDDVVLIKR